MNRKRKKEKLKDRNEEGKEKERRQRSVKQRFTPWVRERASEKLHWNMENCPARCQQRDTIKRASRCSQSRNTWCPCNDRWATFTLSTFNVSQIQRTHYTQQGSVSFCWGHMCWKMGKYLWRLAGAWWVWLTFQSCQWLNAEVNYKPMLSEWIMTKYIWHIDKN